MTIMLLAVAAVAAVAAGLIFGATVAAILNAMDVNAPCPLTSTSDRFGSHFFITD